MSSSNYSKKIKIKFNDPFNPFTSMGRLISFYNEVGDVTAHLSLTWESHLWFAYYSKKDKCWKDLKSLGTLFSFCVPKDDIYEFNFIIDDCKVIITQHSDIQEYDLDHNIQFEDVRYLENFDNFEAEAIPDLVEINLEKTEISFLDCDLSFTQDVVHNKKKIDVVIIGFRTKRFLPICLDLFYETYNSEKIEIGNIIFCNNNIDEDEYKVEEDIIKRFCNENNFNLKMIKGLSNVYCDSRVTATKQALPLCSNDFVILLEPDTFLLNDKWNLLFDKFDNYKDINIIAGIQSSFAPSTRMRTSMGFLPRMMPCFLISKTKFLQDKLKNDPDIFGDYSISFSMESISILLMGMHFTKLYLDMTDKKEWIYDFNACRSNLSFHPRIEEDCISKVLFLHYEKGSTIGEITEREKAKIGGMIEKINLYCEKNSTESAIKCRKMFTDMAGENVL